MDTLYHCLILFTLDKDLFRVEVRCKTQIKKFQSKFKAVVNNYLLTTKLPTSLLRVLRAKNLKSNYHLTKYYQKYLTKGSKIKYHS